MADAWSDVVDGGCSADGDASVADCLGAAFAVAAACSCSVEAHPAEADCTDLTVSVYVRRETGNTYVLSPWGDLDEHIACTHMLA